MAKSSSPVSSFGPELMTVLRKGADSRSVYALPDPKAAFRFMSRINSLRAAMRREGHVDSDRVYRAGIRIDKENKCNVIVEPRDSEFGDILKRAGVDGPFIPPTGPILEVIDDLVKPGVAPDSADSFLANLTSKKSS